MARALAERYPSGLPEPKNSNSLSAYSAAQDADELATRRLAQYRLRIPSSRRECRPALALAAGFQCRQQRRGFGVRTAIERALQPVAPNCSRAFSIS